MVSCCPISFFFSDLPGGWEELFPVEEEAWEVLRRLKPFIRETIQPNLPPLVPLGVPLTTPIVLLPGGVLTEGFEVVCGEATKGAFSVKIEGELAPEASLLCAGAIFTDGRVQIGKGVVIEPGALVKGPAIIGNDTEIRQGAYMRGDCLIGRGCVVGHTTEVKHAVFMDGAKAGHFAYVGDSVLGARVNLGAGTKLANLKFSSGNVSLRINGNRVDTGLRKIGAILGDNVQTGCNSVSNPGSLVGMNAMIPPNTTVRPGFYPPRSIIR